MRLLLDTHTFLWFISDASELSESSVKLILDPLNDVFLSIASAWEMTIKLAKGKLKLEEPFIPFLHQQLTLTGIQLLPIQTLHLETLLTLPFHHRDPFDRLLIAQAKSESMRLLSKDSAFLKYEIDVAW